MSPDSMFWCLCWFSFRPSSPDTAGHRRAMVFTQIQPTRDGRRSKGQQLCVCEQCVLFGSAGLVRDDRHDPSMACGCPINANPMTCNSQNMATTAVTSSCCATRITAFIALPQFYY